MGSVFELDREGGEHRISILPPTFRGNSTSLSAKTYPPQRQPRPICPALRATVLWCAERTGQFTHRPVRQFLGGFLLRKYAAVLVENIALTVNRGLSRKFGKFTL